MNKKDQQIQALQLKLKTQQATIDDLKLKADCLDAHIHYAVAIARAESCIKYGDMSAWRADLPGLRKEMVDTYDALHSAYRKAGKDPDVVLASSAELYSAMIAQIDRGLGMLADPQAGEDKGR